MTRGTFGVISSDGVFTVSDLFHGDMYIANDNGAYWGSLILDALPRIKSRDELERFQAGFRVMHDYRYKDIKDYPVKNLNDVKLQSVGELDEHKVERIKEFFYVDDDYLFIDRCCYELSDAECLYIKNNSNKCIVMQDYKSFILLEPNKIYITQ